MRAFFFARRALISARPVVFIQSQQAAVCWQWVSYLKDQVPRGKEPLMLNLDETRVSRRPGAGKGNILVSSREHRRQRRPGPTHRATKAQLRGGMTLVAMIADRADAQAALPQPII
jgi:hypothetical protein